MRCSGSVALPAIIKVIGLGLIVSGCAGSSQDDARSNVGMTYPVRVAVAAPPKVELEGDGTAVQAPPWVRRKVEPDDPSEPYSRNYGPAPERIQPPEAPAEKHMAPPRKADVAPAAVILRSRLLSADEAQAVMVQAMIAHERRNP